MESIKHALGSFASSPRSPRGRGSPVSPSFQTQAIPVPSKSTAWFVVVCLAWYLSSALSSNTSKALLSAPKSVKLIPEPTLNQTASNVHDANSIPLHHVPKPSAPFPYPVTLTFIQFLFVAGFCLLCTSERILGSRRLSKAVAPTKETVLEVGQLSVFAVVGHILSSVAISRVPVSTVHTIKALSPLFTVLAYSFLFSVTYSPLTWFSLIPLTFGVMIACSGLSLSAGDLLGVVTALGSTMIFVAQNIYSKKLLNASGHGSESGTKDKPISTGAKSSGRKLDKINILLYSSGCASVLMVPLVLYYDAPIMLRGAAAGRASLSTIVTLLLCNGVVHFAQNLLAFSVLALVSPVTYSVASLLKRVFVICFAIIWFRQAVTLLQWFGIILTFTGLYLYNNTKTKQDVSAGEDKARHAAGDVSLPTSSSNGFVNANGRTNGAPTYLGATGYEAHRAAGGIAPTSARAQNGFFQHQPHMSVSKVAGSFLGSKGGHGGGGVSGPGSWLRSGPRSPGGYQSNGTAIMSDYNGHGKHR